MDLTILIPCYNNALYLEDALNSLKDSRSLDSQSFKIIAINDGSKDNSLDILKKFIKIMPNLSIIDKENSGYGDSLNIALRQVKTKYVGILEPDDLAFVNGFATLLSAAEKHDLDICRGYYISFNQKKEWNCKKSWIPNDKIFSSKEVLEVFIGGPSIWCAIYKTDFLKKNQIEFLTTPGASFQDTSFAFKCYLKASKIMFIDTPIIRYRTDNANSSVNSKEKVDFLCKEWAEIIRYFEKYGSNSVRIKKALPILQNGSYQWNLDRLDSDHKKDFVFLWSCEIKKFIKDGYVSWKWTPIQLWFKFFLLAKFPTLFYYLHKNLNFQTHPSSLKKISISS